MKTPLNSKPFIATEPDFSANKRASIVSMEGRNSITSQDGGRPSITGSISDTKEGKIFGAASTSFVKNVLSWLPPGRPPYMGGGPQNGLVSASFQSVREMARCLMRDVRAMGFTNTRWENFVKVAATLNVPPHISNSHELHFSPFLTALAPP
ncbi:hypothetical protein BC830DRAFT_1169092 [Chytriomyces sp. MP71]|nr:hypothetical protein BC830DRAFT_1169092 [Chytriomyces sp. MP71]